VLRQTDRGTDRGTDASAPDLSRQNESVPDLSSPSRVSPSPTGGGNVRFSSREISSTPMRATPPHTPPPSSDASQRPLPTDLRGSDLGGGTLCAANPDRDRRSNAGAYARAHAPLLTGPCSYPSLEQPTRKSKRGTSTRKSDFSDAAIAAAQRVSLDECREAAAALGLELSDAELASLHRAMGVAAPRTCEPRTLPHERWEMSPSPTDLPISP
jgi:hypothetical protein